MTFLYVQRKLSISLSLSDLYDYFLISLTTLMPAEGNVTGVTALWNFIQASLKSTVIQTFFPLFYDQI